MENVWSPRSRPLANINIQRLVHTLNEDDPDRQLQFCEWFLHKCDKGKIFKTKVPAMISRFKPSRLLPLRNFKVHGVHHKTTNTGETGRSDWTCHQWYSISNNQDGMSLSSTSPGVHCGRRWTFWTCTSLRKLEQNTNCISVSLCCWEITFQRVHN